MISHFGAKAVLRLKWSKSSRKVAFSMSRTLLSVQPFSTITIKETGPIVADYKSVDKTFELDRIKRIPGEENKRDFIYFLLGGGRFAYASFARLAVIKCIASMSATADVLALASGEYDISGINEGSTLTVKWRGKPVMIRHRTDHEIALASETDISNLPDPQLDKDRVQTPEWLIVIGICTHLGCVPIPNAGDYQGWFCPCHGSHYDTSGRIRKGPAPLNLEIPPYRMEGSKLIVG